jgi:hypothetical protein
MGELADGGRLRQGRDPLLSLAPVRQCRLDRGLARGREIGDVLALVDVPNLDGTKPRRPKGLRLRPIVERSSAASAARPVTGRGPRLASLHRMENWVTRSPEGASAAS